MGGEDQVVDLVAMRTNVDGVLVVEMAFVVFEENPGRVELDDDIVRFGDVGGAGEL